MKTYKRTYRMLIAYGFSPFKAAQIVLDARRADYYALSVIRIAFGMR